MILAQLVVSGAFLLILEYFVGFADLLEARFGVLLLTHVWVIFASELAISLLYLRLGSIACHAHDLVIIS